MVALDSHLMCQPMRCIPCIRRIEFQVLCHLGFEFSCGLLLFEGDWHCAYVLLYGPRILKIDESQNGEEKSEETKEESKSTTDSAMETS